MIFSYQRKYFQDIEELLNGIQVNDTQYNSENGN